jgi:hypothetical protein
MNGLLKKSLRLRFVGPMLLLGVAALAGTGQVALGQDSVRGTFVLPVAAHLGDTVLPAGEYKFYVQAVGSMQVTDPIQSGSGPVLVVIYGAKDGPIMKVLATSSKLDAHDPKVANLQADDAGIAFQSLYLESMGVELEFYANKSKRAMLSKGPVVAQSATPVKASN